MGLKTFQLYDRWSALIGQAERDTIVEAIAPTWLPVELAVAHYEACDRLEIDDTQMLTIGEAVGKRLQGTLLSTAGKLARNVGVTPDIAARCFAPLLPRIFQGGSLQLEQTGPKDLVLEFRQTVLTRCRYFRGTLLGNVKSAAVLLGVSTPYVKLAQYDAAKDRTVIHMSYV